ncbi:GlxA family transcriptional regulator [uncultured Sneathiella sp.]|jgi:transcriptional regulator GlxA family with amidase domain|uniref:GlxA family transcriptional regulator n=1 Tax=uncultured Sneathiella sp. TaxID=879315 RepID=UPI0030DA5F91|tara:strand:+ start:834 stop:1799 length:966 start_codon:yes stop_codon:yes gene_type:complete
MTEKSKRFGFLLTDQSSMICFSSAIEPLRSANRMSGRHLYDWNILSVDGLSVQTSNGLSILPDMALADAACLDILFVCGGIGTDKIRDEHLFAELRRIVQHGTEIGALSTGAFVLAAAGLLDGYRCTIHWEGAISLKESYPKLIFTGSIFEIDRNRYTCAGGTSAIDLLLYMISKSHGDKLAYDISLQFMHDRIRSHSDKQQVVRKLQLAAKSQKLLTIVEIMEQNIEEPLSPEELASMVGISIRQVERLFRQHTGRSPARYYMEMRLEHARLLLLQTSMSITEIYVASGFSTHSHFAKSYREYYGLSPSRERKPVFPMVY